MGIVILALSGICGLVSLVCWVMTIVKAFSESETLLGVLSLCPLVGFILGWMNVSKWNHMPIMAAWSGAVVVNIILNVLVAAMGAGN